MSLILPTRRKLLATVPALATARVLSSPAIARSLHGGISGPMQTPAQAQAWGYNTLAFYDDFTSLSTIDLTDTQANGFKWYVHNAWPNEQSADWRNALPTPASCFSLSSGTVLECGPTVPSGQFGNLLSTACANPSNPALARGFTVRPGFYVEASFSWRPLSSYSGSGSWPAFWSVGTQVQTNPTATVWDEVDIFEVPPGSPTNRGNLPAIHRWDPSDHQNVFSQQPLPAAGATLNTYGFLSVPMALNGGTGIMADYVNNAVVTATVQNYSATGMPSPLLASGNVNGALSEFESQDTYFLWGWDNTSTISIDWMKVWTP